LHDDMKPFTSDLEVLSCNPSRVYRFLVKAACKPCRLLSDLEHFWSFPSKNEGVLIKWVKDRDRRIFIQRCDLNLMLSGACLVVYNLVILLTANVKIVFKPLHG
jgi:hypothetical protein